MSTSRRLWRSHETPFDRLTLTGSERGLTGLFFAGGAPRLDESDHRPDAFEQAMAQLDEYFAGTRQRFELALDLSAGTVFQRAVWDELQAIPFGRTISYGDLAARIGRLDRTRAVGAAVGRNPVPIIIPCHRVIAADGRLTGYVGGLHRKQALLDAEAAIRRGAGADFGSDARQLALL
jgi:methylated-DNA-[protein]-cysteine S-methyltransferase